MKPDRYIKRVALCLAAALLLLAFAGCSGRSEKQVDLQAVARELEPQLTDEMLELTDNTVGEYYNLDLEEIESYLVRKSASGSTAQELALFKAKSSAGADAAEAAVRERIEDQKFNYEAYLPAEMTKINNAVVIRSGNYVFFACVDDDAAARAALQNALK